MQRGEGDEEMERGERELRISKGRIVEDGLVDKDDSDGSEYVESDPDCEVRRSSDTQD